MTACSFVFDYFCTCQTVLPLKKKREKRGKKRIVTVFCLEQNRLNHFLNGPRAEWSAMGPLP